MRLASGLCLALEGDGFIHLKAGEQPKALLTVPARRWPHPSWCILALTAAKPPWRFGARCPASFKVPPALLFVCLLSVPQFPHTAQGRRLTPVSPGSHSRSWMLLGCCPEQREVSSLSHGCRDAAVGKSRRFTDLLCLEGLLWEKLQQGPLQPYIHG